MIPLFACWYYRRFLCPYVDGTLEARGPVICRRLQRHLARCEPCRTAMRTLERTSRDLHAFARTARAEDIHAVPPRASWRRPMSLADRVASQIQQIEGGPRSRRRRRVRFMMGLMGAVFLGGCMTLSRPNPARQWLQRNVLGQAAVIGYSHGLTMPHSDRQMANPATKAGASIGVPAQYVDQVKPGVAVGQFTLPGPKSAALVSVTEFPESEVSRPLLGKSTENTVHHKSKSRAPDAAMPQSNRGLWRAP